MQPVNFGHLFFQNSAQNPVKKTNYNFLDDFGIFLSDIAKLRIIKSPLMRRLPVGKSSKIFYVVASTIIAIFKFKKVQNCR